MKLKVKKLHPLAIIPKYQTEGAVCFDLHAFIVHDDWGQESTSEKRVVNGFPCVVRTGLSFEIPEDHVMLVFPRSGLAFKECVTMLNCTGVIDSDYRGEVRVLLEKRGDNDTSTIKHGDRIAQAMIVPIPVVVLEEVEELSSTERGTGGYGSTGR